MKNQERIPGLDGVRAMAILIVLVGHLAVRFESSLSRYGLLFRVLGSGGVGVDVFFVLSGFLITTLLLREHQQLGSIRIGNFYKRRAFRILPAFYAYLAAIIVLSPMTGWKLPLKGIAMSSLFLYDYAQLPHPWLVAHTWSLAVEEQFYLFWPVLLAFCLRRWGQRSAIAAACSLILIATVFRNLDAHYHYDSFLLRDFMMLHTRVDTLMFGCLFALCSGFNAFESMVRAIARIWWIFPLWFLAAGNLMTRFFGLNFRLSVGMTLNGFAIACFIVFVTRHPDSWIGRLLTLRPIAFIGVLSYSIYLWQQLFTAPQNFTWSGKIPGMLFAIGVIPALSYFAVERPFLRLRDKVLTTRESMPLDRTLRPAAEPLYKNTELLKR